ncbi:MAG: hypothetical protein WCI53_05455 [Bacteroidota bacterium]
MKKTNLKLAFIISIIIGSTFSSNAQVVTEGSKQIYLGLGWPNIPGLVYTTLGSGGGSSFGPICASFQYGIKDKITVGGTLNYSSANSPSFSGEDINGNTTSYSLKLSLITIMATGTYHYSNSDKADFYSGISLGYGIASAGIDGNKGVGTTITVAEVGGAAYHITPIGFRYMFSDNIGAYTELGYGWNGLAQIGLSAKF